MISVREITRVAETPDILWRRIGSFVSLGEWHPLCRRVDSDGDIPGAMRRVLTRSGDVHVERLESFDASLHVYRYSRQSRSAGIGLFTAEFHVDGAYKESSVVIWSVRFEAIAGREHLAEREVREFLRVGLNNLTSPRLVGVAIG